MSSTHWHPLPVLCPHSGTHVCQQCAQLTDDEAHALNRYFAAAQAKRRRGFGLDVVELDEQLGQEA